MSKLHKNCFMILLFCLFSLATVMQPNSTAAAPVNFTFDVVYESDTPIFGLAIGDFNPSFEGDEAACLVNPSNVIELIPGDWYSTQIFSSTDAIMQMTNRPTIDIGNVMGGETNEVIVCGNNFVTVIYEAMEQWNTTRIYDKSDLAGSLWGARAGDYDYSRPGEEVLVIFETVFDFSIADLVYEQDFEWFTKTIYGQEVGMDSAAGEFDPNREGTEIVITTEMGPTYEITPPENGQTEDHWPKTTLWDDMDDAGWVVKIADVTPVNPGNELVYGSRYNNKIMISYPNPDGSGNHIRETLFQGETGGELRPGNMWDIAIGDVLPDIPGNEILGVDDNGSVYLLWLENGEWQSDTIWQDQNALYAVAAGELIPNNPGMEILVGGMSQTVTMFQAKPTSAVNSWQLYE